MTIEAGNLYDRACIVTTQYEQIYPEDTENFYAVAQEMYEILCELTEVSTDWKNCCGVRA